MKSYDSSNMAAEQANMFQDGWLKDFLEQRKILPQGCFIVALETLFFHVRKQTKNLKRCVCGGEGRTKNHNQKTHQNDQENSFVRRKDVFQLAAIIHHFNQVVTKQNTAIAACKYFHNVNIKAADDLFKVVQVGRARNNRKK